MRTSRWLGPVFGFEALTVPRRWQIFAGRALFVLCLLGAMSLLWAPADHTFTTQHELAEIGWKFFQSMTILQISVLLLVAPAATAGALCVDKGRGTLYHMFVTDLSDREILLGKLGVRLLSVLTILGCGVPVMALAGLLGGVDFEAIVGVFLVSAGVAIVGCSLATAFSVWVRKPHQALLPTYVVLAVWLLVFPVLSLWITGSATPTTASTQQLSGFRLGSISVAASPLPSNVPTPGLKETSSTLYWSALMGNPYGVAFAPYLDRDHVSLGEPIAFLLGTLVASAGLVLISIRALRPVAVRQMDAPKRLPKSGVPARIVSLIPGPPLDGNPVLWREWHRKKPTKWVGRLWALYTLGFGLASLAVIAFYFLKPGRHWGEIAAMVNAWEVVIGLLLLTISATTSLAEERDRGSLDVIMATPLPTRTILWGKWWGTFAMVPRMAILPIWVSAGMALVSGNFGSVLLMIAVILSMSVAVTSLGIALATWIPRLGRAIATGVLIYALGSLGLVFFQSTLNQPATRTSWVTQTGRTINGTTFTFQVQYQTPVPTGGLQSWQQTWGWDWPLLATPYYAVAETTLWAGRLPSYNLYDNPDLIQPYHVGQTAGHGWIAMWIAVYLGFSALLMTAVLWTFDRCLGRITRATPNWDLHARLQPGLTKQDPIRPSLAFLVRRSPLP